MIIIKIKMKLIIPFLFQILAFIFTTIWIGQPIALYPKSPKNILVSLVKTHYLTYLLYIPVLYDICLPLYRWEKSSVIFNFQAQPLYFIVLWIKIKLLLLYNILYKSSWNYQLVWQIIPYSWNLSISYIWYFIKWQMIFFFHDMHLIDKTWKDSDVYVSPMYDKIYNQVLWRSILLQWTIIENQIINRENSIINGKLNTIEDSINSVFGGFIGLLIILLSSIYKNIFTLIILLLLLYVIYFIDQYNWQNTFYRFRIINYINVNFLNRFYSYYLIY